MTRIRIFAESKRGCPGLLLVMALSFGFIALFPPDVLAQMPSRFRLGLITGGDETVQEQMEPFRLYLEDALDKPVDLFLFPTLGQAAAALADQRIDYARLSPTAYVLVQKACTCVDPLATGKLDPQTARFHAVVLGRAEAQDGGLESLRGGRLGVGPPGSVARRMLPLALMRPEGTAPEDFFGEIILVPTPMEAVRDLLADRLDAVTGWSTLSGPEEAGYSAGTLRDLRETGEPANARPVVLWSSPPLPFTAHTVRKDLDPVTKDRLKEGLLSLQGKAPEIYALVEPDLPGGLAAVTSSDFDPLLATLGQGAE